jgi:hypothetical protein
MGWIDLQASSFLFLDGVYRASPSFTDYKYMAGTRLFVNIDTDLEHHSLIQTLPSIYKALLHLLRFRAHISSSLVCIPTS